MASGRIKKAAARRVAKNGKPPAKSTRRLASIADEVLDLDARWDAATEAERAAQVERLAKLTAADPSGSQMSAAIERRAQAENQLLRQELAQARRLLSQLPVESLPLELAPVRRLAGSPDAWEGSCRTKPWQYRVTAVIPELDTPDELIAGIELLRLQTERPYILVIDTGSTPENFARVEALRAQDLEVHAIRLNGVLHPSEFVTAAMDLAFSICRTEYLYCTHSDVFPRRRDWLEWLFSQCSERWPAVGYEMTPRMCPGMKAPWQRMLGHSATMLHMPTMDRIGGGWSMRRLARRLGLDDQRPIPGAVGWPDTEVLLGYLLRDHGIETKVAGIEANYKRTLDANIDHCRSLAGSKLYAPEKYREAKAWAEDALQQAKRRAAQWRKQC